MTTESGAKPDAKTNDKPEKPEKPVPPETAIETSHELSLAGASHRYLATVTTTHILNDDGDAIGEIFHTVYTLSKVLFPEGYEGRDGGYALKHEWL